MIASHIKERPEKKQVQTLVWFALMKEKKFKRKLEKNSNLQIVISLLETKLMTEFFVYDCQRNINRISMWE